MSGTRAGTPAPMARTAPVSALTEVVNHKSMVPEPGWFNGDRKTFEDWWRAMKLYLRANKITDADKKIIAVLGRFRGGTAGAFAQQKLDRLDEGDDTPSWDAFEAELQLVYSDKTKEADVEWRIETFTQGKKHIADFLIEFMALASKAQTNDQHAIFLLKKNVNREIIRAIMAYPPTQAPKSLEQWKVAITAVGQGYEWTNIHYDYRTGSRITYGGMGKPMEIGRQQNNGQGRKPKCYNCNKFGHIAKDC